MTSWILSHEPTVRLATFVGILLLMAVWELVAERRELRHPRRRRWIANLAIAVVDTLVVRLLFPAAAVGVALFAEAEGWGLLNRIGVPRLTAIVLSVLALDLVIYGQHVMFHHIPFLWRVHLVHHADHDFDVTTGIRFHPIEIVLSILIKSAAILVLGPPAVAVLLFEVVLNATSLFNHGNVRLPLRLDRWLRWILVTPDMHRVHHSVDRTESNRNFGFNLPWWDRLFGTYQAQPHDGHEGMRIGIEALESTPPESLPGVLALPFSAPRGSDPQPR